MTFLQIKRLRIIIHGIVQGVGFRPFVFNLAQSFDLKGFIQNSAEGVHIEIEGPLALLDGFLEKIANEKPVHSYIQSMESVILDLKNFKEFSIRKSKTAKKTNTLVLPDIATCPDCLQELFDPGNRRYLYPFINCTQCGPRYSIIKKLPYDRPNTTMHEFEMCAKCRLEYEDPGDRRFHAQPIACHDCGPQVYLLDARGNQVKSKNDAIEESISLLKKGKIFALKGLGGYQLIVDAESDKAVSILRQRKKRPEKPFAVMFPDLDEVKKNCIVNSHEERLLKSPESPIVLLAKKENTQDQISELVSPGNPYLGAMLPYTPLHHLILSKFGHAVVATSGNVSNEPICIRDEEALSDLSGLADFFLVHTRLIQRAVDDSIVRIVSNREMLIRRARGYAPLPILMNKEGKQVLGVGAHLKNTIALSSGRNVFLSQHIGDLETEKTFNTFIRTILDIQELFCISPVAAGRDLHDGYLSSQYLENKGLRNILVQHHHAHIVSCMAENELEGNVLGVAWDGTGIAQDGKSIWGGEFLYCDESSFERFGSFAEFSLPGGDQAINEPRRSLLGLLYEIFGIELFENESPELFDSFSSHEFFNLKKMLIKGINSPRTTSVGRLFDGISSLLNLCQVNNFEGQGAMMLEFIIAGSGETKDNSVKGQGTIYSFDINEEVLDWKPMVLEILDDVKKSKAKGYISKKFHDTLAEIIIQFALVGLKKYNNKRIVLSGGCFQNKYLLERSVARLQSEGFKPYWHQRIPTNDGGVALGQAVIANSITKQEI